MTKVFVEQLLPSPGSAKILSYIVPQNVTSEGILNSKTIHIHAIVLYCSFLFKPMTLKTIIVRNYLFKKKKKNCNSNIYN